MTYTCPQCGATSHHPEDERNGYCGRCHEVTSDTLAQPVWLGEVVVGRLTVALDVRPGRPSLAVSVDGVRLPGRVEWQLALDVSQLVGLAGGPAPHRWRRVAADVRHDVGPGRAGQVHPDHLALALSVALRRVPVRTIRREP